MKKLVESYHWEEKHEFRIQNLILDETFTNVRYQLLSTFYHIIKNDISNKCALLNDVNESCWHALILWFFDKK